MYMKKKWIASQAAMAFAMAAMTVLLAAGCDNGMTGAVAVVIAGQKDVAVESVTIEPDTLTLATGTARKLTATVTPSNATDKTVTWQSSNDWVAEVDDDGTVRAVGTGSATIYAQAGDKTATCRVTVKNILVEVERVTLSEETLTLMYGETATLTATVEPDNADENTAMWSSSDTAVATMDENGTVTAVGIGTATIYAQAGNKRAACLVTVRLPDAEAEGFEINVNGTLTKYTGTDTDVTIPDGVRTIGNSAFKGYTSLTGVEIPEGVTSIGYGAFEGCTSLTSVTIPASVKTIAQGSWGSTSAFSKCENLDTVTYQGTLAQWCALASNGGLMSYAKHVTMSDGTDLKTMTNLAIPNGMESIGESAFEGCTSLTSITIPKGVTSIGGSTFYGCTSLTSVTIPDGVREIGSSTFYGCTSLESVTIPKGVTSIGESAFYGCTSLTDVTIPEGVTSIGVRAFEGCTSLTSVTIGDDVTEIGEYAFYDCTSLTTINYTGTKEDWNGIDKEWGIFSNTKVNEIIDKDGNTFQVDKSGNITD